MILEAIALEAAHRAAEKDIRLRAFPSVFNGGVIPEVCAGDPPGHYFCFRWNGPVISVQICVIDDFRKRSDVYADLVPGFTLTEIVRLPCADEVPLDHPSQGREFVSIQYKQNS